MTDLNAACAVSRSADDGIITLRLESDLSFSSTRLLSSPYSSMKRLAAHSPLYFRIDGLRLLGKAVEFLPTHQKRKRNHAGAEKIVIGRKARNPEIEQY